MYLTNSLTYISLSYTFKNKFRIIYNMNKVRPQNVFQINFALSLQNKYLYEHTTIQCYMYTTPRKILCIMFILQYRGVSL